MFCFWIGHISLCLLTRGRCICRCIRYNWAELSVTLAKKSIVKKQTYKNFVPRSWSRDLHNIRLSDHVISRTTFKFLHVTTQLLPSMTLSYHSLFMSWLEFKPLTCLTRKKSISLIPPEVINFTTGVTFWMIYRILLTIKCHSLVGFQMMFK